MRIETPSSDTVVPNSCFRSATSNRGLFARAHAIARLMLFSSWPTSSKTLFTLSRQREDSRRALPLIRPHVYSAHRINRTHAATLGPALHEIWICDRELIPKYDHRQSGFNQLSVALSEAPHRLLATVRKIVTNLSNRLNRNCAFV